MSLFLTIASDLLQAPELVVGLIIDAIPAWLLIPELSEGSYRERQKYGQMASV